MIIFVYGPDVYRSRQYLAKMVQKFKVDRDPAGYNVATIDVDSAQPNSVMAEILAAPFLAEKRMVVVKHLLGGKQADVRAQIAERIKLNTLPESTVLVVWEDVDTFKAKDAKALFELLQKEKYKEHFAALTPGEAMGWLKQEVEAAGCTLEPTAASFLVENVGVDSLRLRQILDQLTAYKQTGVITRSDAALFVDETADDNIFTLVDAIVGRQLKTVYKMMREQYRQGEDPTFIVLMLIRQFRIMLQLRDLFERDEAASSDAVAKRLGLHPFVVKKTLPIIKRYTLDQLRATYDQLLIIDRQTKTGLGNQSVLVDVLVARI